MQRLIRFTLAGFVFLPFLAGSTHAAVVPVAWYKLGEDDPGAVAGATGQNPTQDSTANNFDLTPVGSPTYDADTAATALGSSLSMKFNGTSDYYALAAPVTTATTNVGIEAWAKPDNAAAPSLAGYVAYNGTGGGDGYGFIQGGVGLHDALPDLSDTHWYALVGSIASVIDMGPVAAGEWVHLGMVIDSSGNVSVYENGTLVTSVARTVITPTADFQIGAYAPVPQQYFEGKIDQVRVFTFTGTFSPNDFLIGTVPEPSSLALLVCAGVLIRRRPRQQLMVGGIS